MINHRKAKPGYIVGLPRVDVIEVHMKAEKKSIHRKNSILSGKTFTRKKNRSLTKLHKNLSISGASFIDIYHFDCGNDVPVYEVQTVHALNQIIGHAKFNNQLFGNVYYRGECKLHSSLKPSLFRGVKNTNKVSESLMKLIDRIIKDPGMDKILKITGSDLDCVKIYVEGMLQHYGIPTRFIDVVDNHWIALWMGLNRSQKIKQIGTYYHYTERSIPLIEMTMDSKETDESLFQYIVLIAIPFSEKRMYSGIDISPDYIEVDLRQALPSLFLRPHAQHGLVLRRKVHQPTTANTDDYDMAPSIIGIIRIRIDRVHEWIGSGELLSQNNLFPPRAYDYGYDLLLSRGDLFEGFSYAIAQYV